MARMPLPVPMSSTRSPPFTSSSSTVRHRAVVSWVPVPKAMPGSMRSTVRPVSYSSQLGTMAKRLPMSIAW